MDAFVELCIGHEIQDDSPKRPNRLSLITQGVPNPDAWEWQRLLKVHSVRHLLFTDSGGSDRGLKKKSLRGDIPVVGDTR